MSTRWSEVAIRLAAGTVLLFGILLSGCAEEEGTTPGEEMNGTGVPGATELRTFAYECDDSTYVVASMHHATDGIWLFLPGQTIRLPRLESEPGAKYSDGAVTFRKKGFEALISLADGRTVRCIENRRESWFEDAKLRGMDFRAVGNEPGWTLELGPDRSVLVTDYGNTRFEFATPKPDVDAQDMTAVYRVTVDGTDIVIRTTFESCMDSMDGSQYSHRVEIQVGDDRLLGCGRGLH